MEIPQFILDKTKDFTGREWVYERLNAWLANDTPQHFLLTGGPGTGKSAIAGRLIQYCRGDIPTEKYEQLKQTKLVYFHFCQAQDDATIDARSFVIALYKHLVNWVPALLQVLPDTSVPGEQKTKVNIDVGINVNKVEAGITTIQGVPIGILNIGIKSPREAYQHLIRKPLDDLYQSGFHDKILIIVDGLDEALLMQAETNMVTLLERGRELPLPVRYLFISRPDSRVLSSLGEQTLDLTRDAPPDVDDVRLYANERLASLPQEIKRDLLAERIAKASEGNFLYAQYLIDDLLQRPDMLKDFETISFPKGLDGIYGEFLKRVWKDSFRKVLGVLAVEKGEGLTRVQIADICRFEESEVEEILSSYSQFIHGQKPQGPFHLYHHSFREFLLAGKIYQVFPEEAHKRIADYFLSLYADDWSICQDRYALQHTPDHLAEALKLTTSPTKQSELKNSLFALLTNFQYIEAKITKGFLWDLIDDYDHLPGYQELQLIQGALSLSAHVLLKDPKQLPSQLIGRLHWLDNPGINKFIGEVKGFNKYPWLCPMTDSLTPPGGPLIRILYGHSKAIIALAVTPDGRRAISGSYDDTLKVWDLKSGKEVHTLTGHKEIVTLAVTPDGQHAVTGSWDNTLKVWDLKSGKELYTLEGHKDRIDVVMVTPDGRRAISGSYDETLKVWDLKSGKEVHTLTGHKEIVTTLAITPDGQRAVSGSWDNTLKVWDLKSGKELYTLTGHKALVTEVVLSSDGNKAVSGSADNTLKIWDLNMGRELFTLTGHVQSIDAVAVTPDGQRVISGSLDRTLKVWDLNTGKEIHTLAGHSGLVNQVAVTPDGKMAVSGSWDCTLRVWDLNSGQRLYTFTGHTFEIVNVIVTPDGRRAISGSMDKTIRIWDLDRARNLLTPKGNDVGVCALLITPDGRQVISGSLDKTIRIWDLDSGEEVSTLTCDKYMVSAVAVTPDGQRAISLSADNTLKVWNPKSCKEIHSLTCRNSILEPEDMPPLVAVTPDGKKAVSSWAAALKVWDLMNGKELHTLLGHRGMISAIAVTPDGQFAVTGSDSEHQNLKVWNLNSGKELLNLKGHLSTVSAVSVTPDGKKAVSGSRDSTLKVWDLNRGKLLHTLSGDFLGVSAVAVTSNGQRAVSVSEDKILTVWDITKEKIIAEFYPEADIKACTYAELSGLIIAGDIAGQIYILRLYEEDENKGDS